MGNFRAGCAGTGQVQFIVGGEIDKTRSGHLIVVSTLLCPTIMTKSDPVNGKEHSPEQEELEEADEETLADVAASGMLDEISFDSC